MQALIARNTTWNFRIIFRGPLAYFVATCISATCTRHLGDSAIQRPHCDYSKLKDIIAMNKTARGQKSRQLENWNWPPIEKWPKPNSPIKYTQNPTKPELKCVTMCGLLRFVLFLIKRWYNNYWRKLTSFLHALVDGMVDKTIIIYEIDDRLSWPVVHQTLTLHCTLQLDTFRELESGASNRDWWRQLGNFLTIVES